MGSGYQKHLIRPHHHPFNGMDIRHLLDHQARRFKEHPYLIWEPFEGDSAVFSYQSFVDRVQRTAAGLYHRGIRCGDHVLVHLDNCPEAVIAWFACAWLGAVAVTTNAKSSEDELRYFAEHSAAVAAITQPRFAGLVNQACKHLRWIAVTKTDQGADAGQQAPSWEDCFDSIDAPMDQLPAREPDPLLRFSVQYTSGTTSRPKAVCWTHANALWGARINALHEGLTHEDIQLVSLPLFHTNAQAYSMLASLWAGASAVVMPRFSASRFWPISLKHRCSFASLVQFCIRALAQHDRPTHHHYRLWGSSVCAPPQDSYFGVQTVGWWGMTETITHGITGVPGMPNTALSIGRPAPEYEIRVLTDGREARPGEIGELSIRGVRGLSLFSEYLHNPEATQASFDEEGYFLTGDLVRIGEDGSYFFSDRSKDMLKVGGENVAASEIERVIMAVPGVIEVAVVAKSDPMLDQVPVACLRLAPNQDQRAVEAAVQDACARQLASFKQPRSIKIFDDFPRSTLEKIAKVQLRELIAEEAKLSTSTKS